MTSRTRVAAGLGLVLAVGAAFAVGFLLPGGDSDEDPVLPTSAPEAPPTVDPGDGPPDTPPTTADAGPGTATTVVVTAVAAACSEGPCGAGLELPDLSGADRRFNVGGDEYVDRFGAVWERAGCTGGNPYTSPNEIEPTDDDPLFRSRRFEPECSWEVPDGRYVVTVGWAETFRDQAGYRVFPLFLEGVQAATIDIAGEAGMNTTYLKTYYADVGDGTLDVSAPPQENRSMIALVAATRIGEVPPPPPLASEGEVLEVGDGFEFATLQEALDVAGPGSTVRLAAPGPHRGGVVSVNDGTEAEPITVTAASGAWLECGSPDEDEAARCFQLSNSHYVFDGFSIVGGTSNLYMIGPEPGVYVTDVVVKDSRFRGSPDGGTGECIRIKYQAHDIELTGNDIADCGLGKCCDDSKNGEGIYVGTAPEQLEEKNPSPERDRTHDVWIHHNRIHSWNECVEAKEAAHDILVEYNVCSGQADPESAAFGARGGRVGEGNVFRYNTVLGAEGACARFGGDEDPDGTGNSFYGNTCRDIVGGWGVKQMRLPQGTICGNVFEGILPSSGLSRDESVDPAASCPADVPPAESAAPLEGASSTEP